LKADFDCLGVAFGADAAVCKAAYRALLKKHHPDRYAKADAGKATAKAAGINAAYDRIERWRRGEALD
jgi:curved DNA-binding protein CbpA